MLAAICIAVIFAWMGVAVASGLWFVNRMAAREMSDLNGEG